MVIFAYTTNNKTVTFEVWGVPFNTDEYDEIKLSSEKVSETPPAGEPVEIMKEAGTVKPDGSILQPGERFVAVTARTGYVYQSYKHYLKEGKEVRKEAFAKSTYKAYQGEIWLGPDPVDAGIVVTPQPTLAPMATPEIYVDPNQSGGTVAPGGGY